MKGDWRAGVYKGREESCLERQSESVLGRMPNVRLNYDNSCMALLNVLDILT